jgi:hypothetical protein
MAFSYQQLTEDEKKQIIESRLRQFEGEHFNHELNKLNVETLPASDEKDQQLEAIAEAQATIEQAIEVHLEELAKLDDEEPKKPKE